MELNDRRLTLILLPEHLTEIHRPLDALLPALGFESELGNTFRHRRKLQRTMDTQRAGQRKHSLGVDEQD